MTKKDSALVIGAGIAGIKASLELAEMGHKVFLIERNPNIGGKLTSLDKQYPTDDCTLCQMLPTFGSEKLTECCLRRDLQHENIEIITNAEIENFKGKAGNFSLQIKKEIGIIDCEKCNDCGECEEICPVIVEFDGGVRKAIYVKSPLSAPNSYIIDEINCTKCGKCEEICPTKAIDFSKKEKTQKIDLDVGGIIVALGFEEFNPKTLRQYNYEYSQDIVTNMEFEKLFSGFGINKKEFFRPSDNKKIKKLAILQCIGSRDTDRNYCSSACCMIALKEAILVKESSPEINVTVFYMDMRAFGKNYHKYYEKAKKLGVKFINFRVPNIDILLNRNLLISYFEKGELKDEDFEMVVLSNGFLAPEKNKEIAQKLGINLNEHGFFQTSGISQVETNKDGIYVCGTAVEPKDITDTMIEASAAAMKTSHFLNKITEKENKRDNKNKSDDDEQKLEIVLIEPRKDFKNKLKINEIEKFSKSLSGVTSVKILKSTSNLLKYLEPKIGKLLIANFELQSLSNKFKSLEKDIKELPIIVNPINIPIINDLDKDKNTLIAKKQIEFGVEKLKTDDFQVTKDNLTKRALIIGGGITGLSSALAIAGKGYEVDLIEKSDKLGGNLITTFYTIDGLDTQKFLKETILKVEKENLIKVYKNSNIEDISGYAGNFETIIKTDDEIRTLKNGTIIIATGGKENNTNEYSFGKDKRIITQKELEKNINKNKIKAKNIVMIQCVGSREGENSYCSRICCTTALKNAMKLKENNKDSKIFILNRDIMCYGFLEEFYKKAGEMGISFIRYDLEDKPKVTIKKKIEVDVNDSILGENLNIEADLLVLSTGIVPNENLKLAEKIGLQLDDFGFFKEANAKFRPLDFLKAGIFVCGLAHSPRNLKESISQAYAVAGRAVTILSRENLFSRKEISEVNQRWCVGCELCIVACPFSARVLDVEKGVAKTIDILCQGCGVCAMICPSGVSKLRGAKDKQVFALVDVAV